MIKKLYVFYYNTNIHKNILYDYIVLLHMEYTEPPSDILHLAEAKIHIERLSISHRSIEYQQIVQAINKYLEQKCEHKEIIEDYIDIDPENTQEIKYCNHCGLTL